MEGKRGVGGVQEAGKKGMGSGILKVVGSGRNGKLCNIAQYFTIKQGTNKNRAESVIKRY